MNRHLLSITPTPRHASRVWACCDFRKKVAQVQTFWEVGIVTGTTKQSPKLHKLAKTVFTFGGITSNHSTLTSCSLAINYSFDQQSGKMHQRTNEHRLYGENNKKVFENRKIEITIVLDKFWCPREAEESHHVARFIKLIGKPLLFY